MRGIFGGGSVIAFQELGLAQIFDFVVASSSGANNAAYLLSEQTRLGTSIYYQDLIDSRFINYSRIFKIVDIDYVEQIFRYKKELDVERIRRSRTKFYVTLTNSNNGQGVLKNVKTANDIIRVLKASMAIPGAYNKSVDIDGIGYLDGSFSIPIPIVETIMLAQPTDIVVILNWPFVGSSNQPSIWEKFMGNILLSKYPPTLRQTVFDRFIKYNDSIAMLKRRNDILVIAPDYIVSATNQNPKILIDLANEGIRKSIAAFGIQKDILVSEP